MPKPKRNHDKVRIQLDMAANLAAQLDQIKGGMKASSRTEAIRRMMVLYELVTNKLAAGEKLFIGPDQQTAKEYIFVFGF